jgi:mono/diheme cytochrome c family protein
MMARQTIFAGICALMIGSCILAIAQERKEAASAAHPQGEETAAAAGRAHHDASAATHAGRTARVRDENAMRIEGEKRFRANCGRCHMAPDKFPPRAMATIVRHMRVRAMITDEDMRLILHYMTQ